MKEATLIVIITGIVTAILLILTLLRFVPSKKPLGGVPENDEDFEDLDAPEYSQMSIDDTEMVL